LSQIIDLLLRRAGFFEAAPTFDRTTLCDATARETEGSIPSMAPEQLGKLN
jgi:hypothetical protein